MACFIQEEMFPVATSRGVTLEKAMNSHLLPFLIATLTVRFALVYNVLNGHKAGLISSTGRIIGQGIS